MTANPPSPPPIQRSTISTATNFTSQGHNFFQHPNIVVYFGQHLLQLTRETGKTRADQTLYVRRLMLSKTEPQYRTVPKLKLNQSRMQAPLPSADLHSQSS